jgi:hypothetical protein
MVLAYSADHNAAAQLGCFQQLIDMKGHIEGCPTQGSLAILENIHQNLAYTGNQHFRAHNRPLKEARVELAIHAREQRDFSG